MLICCLGVVSELGPFTRPTPACRPGAEDAADLCGYCDVGAPRCDLCCGGTTPVADVQRPAGCAHAIIRTHGIHTVSMVLQLIIHLFTACNICRILGDMWTSGCIDGCVDVWMCGRENNCHSTSSHVRVAPSDIRTWTIGFVRSTRRQGEGTRDEAVGLAPPASHPNRSLCARGVPIVRHTTEHRAQIERFPDHRHRSLKAIEEHFQIHVSDCFVTELYLHNISGSGVRVVWKLFTDVLCVRAWRIQQYTYIHQLDPKRIWHPCRRFPRSHAYKQDEAVRAKSTNRGG